MNTYSLDGEFAGNPPAARGATVVTIPPATKAMSWRASPLKMRLNPLVRTSRVFPFTTLETACPASQGLPFTNQGVTSGWNWEPWGASGVIHWFILGMNWTPAVAAFTVMARVAVVLPVKLEAITV